MPFSLAKFKRGDHKQKALGTKKVVGADAISVCLHYC